MHTTLLYQLPPDAAGPGVILVSALPFATLLVSAVLRAIVAVVAIIRVLRQPADDWPHGNWSKPEWADPQNHPRRTS